MAKQINTCVGGVIRTVNKVPLSVGGVVREAKKGVCCVAGVIREFYQNEIVLWDGSNLLNGAVNGGSSSSTISSLKYSFDAGSLQDRNLVVIGNSGVESHDRGALQLTLTPHQSTTYFVGNTGKQSNVWSQVASAWTAGQEYIIPFSSLNNGSFEKITAFDIKYFTGDNNYRTLPLWASYIAIR